MKQNQEKTALEALFREIRGKRARIEGFGVSSPAISLSAARLFSELNRPVVVVLPTSKEAELFEDNLKFFSTASSDSILAFPSHPPERSRFLSNNGTAAARIRVLYRFIDSNPALILVTTVDALLQKLLPRRELYDFAEPIEEGQETDLEALSGKLVSGGYVRSIIVEEPGEFSIRGGILDVYCPLYPSPLRIEFYGDTVESLRFFSAETQRTLDRVSEAVLLPAQEAVIRPENRDEIIHRVRSRAAGLSMPVREIRKLVDQIKNEGLGQASDCLAPMVYPNMDSLMDYLPQQTLFLLADPMALDEAADRFKNRVEQNLRSAQEEKRFCAAPESAYLEWSELKERLWKANPVIFRMLPVATEGEPAEPSPVKIHFSVSDNSDVIGRLKQRSGKEHLLLPLAEWLRDKLESGCRVGVVCRSRVQIDRLHSLLQPYGVPIRRISRFSDAADGDAVVNLCIGQLDSGFVWPEEKTAVITENEIFGLKHRRSITPRKQVRTDLLSFDALKREDLVVHVDHGIGQYDGLVKLKLDGATNDYLLLLFKGGDKLYLPIDRMNMIQKYVGVDGIVPVLARLGGKSWEKVKAQVKRSAEKIAGELLELYAARKVRRGVSFGKPDAYFRDFEASFPYEETEDQFKAIEDVLNDMADPKPMDRLICGDVGYGKTEVALRASFMAVYNGKQAAMLVPTTVLAEQHYTTFTERFKKHPVSIACLSRFRTAPQQREIIESLKNGKIDIVIGTHRLLQKDVSFKELGILIVDEEQRFGVKHKEKLKQLRNTVDVLALTATPIPRTLHMSLTGIRDISVISTPPEHRRPIITYISEFDETVIADAIRKELERKGQIFFVHNNIFSIDALATRLKLLVPEVRLDVAHGRMNESELEKVMLRFIKQEIDMLVCTTIIESGLDIPSANTILVNRADKFGLAQMYQLRGRVGRADEQAYAYLFIPRGHSLTKDAQKRLKVLMEHSDLGSGFQIAMSDLKIRGGGTILGAAQSGHIAAVGYDLFLQLMEQAVSGLKGEPTPDPLEPEVNLSISAFLPEPYIPDIDQRLSCYRRLARMTTLKEIADFKKELVDRFGPLPEPAGNLLIKIMLKILCRNAAVKQLDVSGSKLILKLSEAHLKNTQELVGWLMSNRDRFELSSGNVIRAKLTTARMPRLANDAKNILKELSQRVNG